MFDNDFFPREFLESISKQCTTEVKTVERILNTALKEITELMLEGKSLEIKGFGIFHRKFSPARKTFIPNKKDFVETKASYRPGFKFIASFTHKFADKLASLAESPPPAETTSEIPDDIPPLPPLPSHQEEEFLVATPMGVMKKKLKDISSTDEFVLENNKWIRVKDFLDSRNLSKI